MVSTRVPYSVAWCGVPVTVSSLVSGWQRTAFSAGVTARRAVNQGGPSRHPHTLCEEQDPDAGGSTDDTKRQLVPVNPRRRLYDPHERGPSPAPAVREPPKGRVGLQRRAQTHEGDMDV